MTNNQNYTKSFAIKSIMGNPKLSKVLFDAWKSPVGSTKNAHAKSIMKSLSRSADGYIADGRGGPGLPSNPFSQFLGGAPIERETLGPRLPSPITPTPTPTQTPTLDSARQATSALSLGQIGPDGEIPEPEPPRGSVFLKTVDDLTPAVSAAPEITGEAPVSDIVPGADPTGITDVTQPTFDYKDILSKYGVSTEVPQVPDYLSSVQQAVEAGVGPKTFATQAFADKDTLSSLLQVPKETLDWLPESGFLSDYVSDLKQETKSRYNLDAQLQKVQDLESQGLTVESDLQAYVRGKDQYLNQLDKLYNDASIKISGIDTSDPRDAKRMGNYLNYLTILKGRQNQRYIDYVKTSSTAHDAKVTRATNLYKYTRDKFDDDFTDLKEGATEKYGILKDVVTEMYTNIEGREKDLYDETNRQLDLISSALQIDNSVLKNQELRDELSGAKLPPAFFGATKAALNELQQGETWGSVWKRIRQQFPNISNKEIDEALQGGIAETAEEAAEHGVSIGEPWGWARAGAYKEFQSQRGTSAGAPTTAQLTQMVYKLWDIPSEQGGLKGLDDAAKAEYIRGAGLNPTNFGIYE